MALFALFFLFSVSRGEVYLEHTPSSDFENRWVYSKAKNDFGKLVFFEGTETYNNTDTGMQTSEDSKFYTSSLKLDKSLQFGEQDLVLQYSVHNKQNIDCGGTYLKVFPDGLDLEKINSDSPYIFMFGPDKCGSDNKIHVIFRYKGMNMVLRSALSHSDQYGSHVYTLVVKKDLKYSVYVDGGEKTSGDFWVDMDFGLDGKIIEDTDAVKPEDWVDEARMVDTTDTKPDSWVEEEFITDLEATKPADWDDESDGQWETPTKRNPEYIGPWKPRKIPNPDYKGPWVRPHKNNDNFVVDEESLNQKLGSLSLEVWQVQSKSVFSNFLVTDDAEYALSVAKKLGDAYNEFNNAESSKTHNYPKEKDDELDDQEFDKPDDDDELDDQEFDKPEDNEGEEEEDNNVSAEPNPEL